MVKIQHDRKYATLYAHMVHFAKDIHPGTQVKEGQVIGYVGHTGMATGPHLHYEFHVNGIRYNPLTIELPSAAPLNRSARAKFIPLAQQMMARLDNDSKIRLAQNNHPVTSG
jgi:murein DD-endopeptidase MepM/ murein hydrolase activator NlpD